MRWIGLALAMALVVGCGVPREAGLRAGREGAALGVVLAGDDGAVRTALRTQADAWTELSSTVRQKAAFGVRVEADFVALVDRTAALARRQRELIEQGADDPAANRAALEEMWKLWGEVGRYLGN